MRTPPVDQTTLNVTEQLARLDEQFAQLKARVRQAQQLSTLGVAATTIAHEFNNLMTPILGLAKSAVDSDDVEFMRKALTRTVKNAEVVVKMSQRLLKLTAAKPADRRAVGVRAVVDEAYASLCRDLSKDGIRVTFDVDESLTVFADPLQLQQVLFNLFLNAREAMKGAHNGRLTVRASRVAGVEAVSSRPGPEGQPSRRRGGDAVCIEIRNTGKPIPPELLPHIFDAFASTKPVCSDGEARCNGLGLALCSDLIEEDGGTIGVTSEEADGTRFHIVLPAGDGISPSNEGPGTMRRGPG